MKNKLSDLNDHLFAQLERLGDERLPDDALRLEVARAAAVTAVAKEVISNARLVLDAERMMGDLPLERRNKVKGLLSNERSSD